MSSSSCHFYLEKKKRYCRFRPKEGSQYCVEHACVLGIESEKKRIPCPLDPSHNCFEDNLEKHLRKCNVAKIRKVTEQAEFFIKGVNSGNKPAVSVEQNVSISELTSERLATMIDKVKQLYKDHVEIPEVCILEHPSVKVEVTSEIKVIADNCEDNSHLTDRLTENPNLRKELLQQASLIGQLASKKLLQGTSWFVELGAGKGKLSHWVEKACDCEKGQPNCQPEDHPKGPDFLLVDRGSVRYKMDCFHKEDSGRSHFKRIKVDIADLCLGLVSDIKATDSIVVMGKHLCGGATDLGIRCAIDSISTSLKDNPGTRQKDINDAMSVRNNKSNQCDMKDTQEPPTKTQRLEMKQDEMELKQRLPKGMMIALCCHHRCTWDSYVGQDFMQRCGVTSSEFDLLTRLSSWATCARGRDKTHTKKTGEVNDKSDCQRSITDKKSDPKIMSAQLDQGLMSDVKTEEDHVAIDMVSTHMSQGFRESLTISAREEVGRMCKRIIDMGRLHYLRSRGMTSSLREYVSREVTPENVVLLALRP